MEIIFKKNFLKNSKKMIKANSKLQEKLNNCILDFKKHLFSSNYYRKPLKSIWKDIHELQIWWDIRIIIEVLIIDEKCYFLNIWSHSSLNLIWSKKVKV